MSRRGIRLTDNAELYTRVKNLVHEGYSATEIRNETGVAFATIKKYFHPYLTKKKPAGATVQQRDPEKYKRVVEMHDNGHTQLEIVNETGITPATLRKLFPDTDWIERRTANEDWDTAEKLLNGEHSYQHVSRTTGITPDRLRRRFPGRGNPAPHARKFTEQELNSIQRMVDAGYSAHHIALEHGVHYAQVVRLFPETRTPEYRAKLTTHVTFTDLERIRLLVDDDVSLSEITRTTGVRPETIKKYFPHAGWGGDEDAIEKAVIARRGNELLNEMENKTW